jgi:hypothetical protein
MNLYAGKGIFFDNVGIGTTSPQAKLHVAGDYIRVDGAGGEEGYIGGDGAGNDVQIGSFDPSVVNVGLWNEATDTRMNLYAGKGIFFSDVGIGTIDPQAKLHVAGDYIRVDGADGEDGYIGGDGAGNDVQIGSFDPSVVNVGLWNEATNTRMNLYAGKGIFFNDVGIGVLNPENKLHVNGALNLDPMSEPTNPSTGFVLYVDEIDGDLKAKSSTGTITVVASD